MGSNQAKVEEERRRRAEAEAREAEERRRQEEERRRIEQLKKEQRELEIKQEIERQRRAEEERKREREERERRERQEKLNAINQFRGSQNIADFLTLIGRFSYESEFMIKTLEALNEDKVIKNYKDFKSLSDGKIQIIKEAVNENTQFSTNCQRKLVILLFCNEKNNGTCDQIFGTLVKKNENYKKLVFNILIDYSKIFGQDISFKLEDGKIYKQFVEFSIGRGEYLKSLDYRSNDLIQLKILNDNKDKIFDLKDIGKVKFSKLNEYDGAYEVIKDLIKYEKEKNKKLIYFPKTFWENYYNYYKKNENENIIEKLVNLYALLLSYIELGKDDSDYKDKLAEKIHELIKNKLEEMDKVKEQLELLFKNDPYYIYSSDKRDPNIFEKIKIFDLKEEEDMKYFQKKEIEKVYLKNFKEFLEVIIGKITTIEDFNSIIKIIKLEDENNKHDYINLLIQRFNNFFEEEIEDELKVESFINFFGKIIEYYPDIKLKQLEDFLPKFGNNDNIYLKIFQIFKTYEIKKEISVLSIENLNIPTLIELIKKFDEEQKSDYFNNLDKSIITEEDFYKIEDSFNLELLMELIKNKLTCESIYLTNNKENLNSIYEKLTTYDETKEKYLETIINEKEDIQKKFVQRFDLLKSITDENKSSDFNKIKDKYLEVKKYIEDAYEKASLLFNYYKDTESYKVEIDKIKNIYKDYSNKGEKVKKWIDKESEIIEFIRKYQEKANLIKEIKDIKLFQIIYNDFCEGDEVTKFDKAKDLLDGCKVIFEDIQKGNPDILDIWQKKFKKESGIDEELTKLKNYYKIDNSEGVDKVAKNILIFTKKNVYESDIRDILYFLKLFEGEEKDLTKFLKENQLIFKEKEEISFESLVKINNCLEEKKIYINDGKDDSSLIKLIRIFYNKEDQINFIKTKDVDSAQALLYKLNPTTDSLKFDDILEYQSCIAFILDMMAEKKSDEDLLIKLREKIEKDDIKKIISTFKNYFKNYGSIKSLDSNFDSSNDIYENIKDILHNSEFKIEFFKREFKVYDDNKKEKDIMAKDLDGLIQIKDNINLNFELPGDNKVSEKSKEELKQKKETIEKFVKYVEQLQNIIRYFKKLENKGCPFLIDIIVKASENKVTFELVNEAWNYNKLIFTLKEFCKTIIEYQSKFYKKNEYFRLVYDKQLYRLFRRTTSKEEDISSYVRFFTNGDSTKDDVPLFTSKFNDQSKAYKEYKVAIEENFELISNYIKNIFKINNTSLEKLYENIKVKDNLRGIYKCNVKKYNIDQFIIKMFLKLTDNFPIAQNLLLTNNETTTGEIYSFMYRAIKCRFNTLFIISISDDFSKGNLNQMTSLLNKIIRDMKSENVIKEIEDLKPCILFITQNSERYKDFTDAKDVDESLRGDENKLEYSLGKGNSTDSKKTSQNEIYNAVRVYTSDCSGLGKSYLIKKEIKNDGNDYYYFGVGDDITKDDLFIKLEKFIKYEIKGIPHVGMHLDLFYTKNIPLMKYFLFAMLITKLYQTNDNILYIPKNIKIYVEIPNGPQQFLDDYPILTLFQRTNITLDKKLLSDNTNGILNKNLMWEEKEIDLEDKEIKTCIENKNYLKIINYLSTNIKEEDKEKYNEKIKNAAKCFTKCVYSEKLRIKDISQKNKTEKEKKDYIFEFFDFDEKKAEIIQGDNATMIFKTKNGFKEIDISDKEIKDKDTKYFIKNLKEVMSLNESVEEIEKMIGDYKITEDNYKKMILILFRIFANIPVILMGETGCGKTELIKQLMKMLNKDKDKKNKNNNFIIKNMHSGVKENEIIEVIEKAEKNLERSKNDMVCIFFDEINTTSLLSKMKEIFVNHSLNGKPIDERIRFIGACNPFRKNKNDEGDEGLKLDTSNNNEEEMTYMVNPLPNSLLNYIFYFKSLDDHDVKKYIESIIGKEFPENENSILVKNAIEIICDKNLENNDDIKKLLERIINNKESPERENGEVEKKNIIETFFMKNLEDLEKICINTLENLDKDKDKEEDKTKDKEENKKKDKEENKKKDKEKYKKYIEAIIINKFPSILREIAIDAIYTSHKYVREKNGVSSVSLRDLQRFRRAYKFFNEYYEYKKEFLIKRDDKISDKFDLESKIESFVLSLFITYYIKLFKPGFKSEYLQKINDHVRKLAEQSKIKEWVDNSNWKKEPFNTIVRKEEEFLLDEMEVKKEKGIGLNNALKENIFLMFFSIYAYIPLIVVGKPGCSKSLSIQLIIRIMRGELSDSNFLKNYPTINSTGFQGSETNTPESIENIFKVAEQKVDLSQSKDLESIFKEIEEKILSQSKDIESIKNIFKKTNEKIGQSNDYESLKNIFKETNEKIGQSKDLESIKIIFKENEEKILNQSNDPESIKKIIENAEEKILSQTNTPETIKNILQEAKKKISKKKYLSLLVFDELGLSEKSPTNCLKVLHSKLEMSLDPEEKKQVSFIGISNWRLDAAKMNRTIFLAIPDIKLDDVIITVKAIADSYGQDLYTKYENEYQLLGKIYFNYKEELEKEFTNKSKEDEENTKKSSGEDQGKKESEKEKIKNESEEEKSKKESNGEEPTKKKSDEFIANYHGGRDLYNLIKIFSSEMLNNNMSDDPNIKDNSVKKALARNLSGLEINGESSLKKYIKDKNFDDLKTMDLVKDNIKSRDTRFLLLASEKSMFGFLIDIIKNEIENHVTYIGSPFKGDKMNVSYQTEMIVKIENSVAEGKVIILSDLDQIYTIFYDLFNQNYITKDGKKYCRISHGANIQKLALVNENTKFIVLIDKNDLRKQKLPFLSRFEKHIITFENLLNEKDKEKSKNICNILKKLVSVKDINYNLDNILVNTNEDIINGYIYLYKDKEKNSERDIIKDKVIPILSQDIIFTLPLSELKNEKKEFDSLNNDIINSNNKYNSLKDYLQDGKRGKEDILIVYTFSNTGEAIKLSEKENSNTGEENKFSENDNYLERITTEINTVYKFKQILNEFYEIEKYKTLILKFESENSKFINYFISEIKNYKEFNKITDDTKKYIFTINIKRDFNLEKNNKKVTTVLITDEKKNQLFIDNINGAEYSMKDVKKLNIKDFINKDPKKLIVEEMLKFYRENKSEELGIYKGIDSNNFISEFKSFIENSESIIKDIQSIILSQIDQNEKVIDSVIKDGKSINENTTDFITAMIAHIKNIFNETIKELLKKTENNNLFTTLFMLNVKKDSILTTSSNQINDYSFNISDMDILNNKIIDKVKKEIIKLLREKKYEMKDDKSINIKINYKIPGFFKIYKEIKAFINKEKLSISYRQDETEIRKCLFESRSSVMKILSDDIKDFKEKLYIELTSKQLVNKVTEAKIEDKNYIEFVEIFLNDYITFYLENLYDNNIINNFIINDAPHKIILLLLDLKFKELKDDEKKEEELIEKDNPLENVIAKILWLEANSKYIKDIINLYNVISENITYDEKEKEFLFKQILNYNSKMKIKYDPKEKPELVLVNVPFYKIIILLFKCMIDEQSIKNAASKSNDNYYSYFKNLENCLKEMKKIDKILKLDIIELSVLNEFIIIYNVFEHAGKVDKLDIAELISNLSKSLEIIERNDENKIKSLCENLKTLIENIKKALYNSSKINEIKGDTVYYELISNIFLNELKRENNLEYKMYILKEFLLEDPKLFIQANQLLKIILEDFVSSKIEYFQGSLDKLSDSNLKILEDNINNEWIKETLIYTFEYISIIYIQNLINENEKETKDNKKNIVYDLKSYFERCVEFLEKLYNYNEKKGEEKEEESNINLKKCFALAFTRVYLKVFIDWINKKKFTKSSEIEEIIKIINGKEFNSFRDILRNFIYKIIYHMNEQDISKLFEEKLKVKFHLDSYNNFDLLEKEKDKHQNPKDILFVEAYKIDNKEYKVYDEEFNKLSYCLKNSGNKESELKELIESNRLDIFYSVFSTKVSAHLQNSNTDDNQIKILRNIIQNTFSDKEKLLNIFELFLDKSKYTKCEINAKKSAILQFSLRFCLNSDEISEEYDNMYYPLYGDDKNISSYIPGNDIKEHKIYNSYSKIKNYLDNHPSNHGVYVCTCNINKENEEIYSKYEEGNGGYPTKSEKCKYCGELIGKDGEGKSFYERDYYYRIFKNKEDLEKESKDKIKGNCITLEDFFNKYISQKLEEDSKGVNISTKTYFDNTDKPIRHQSQIGYRLMNLILYSHLFTHVLFTDKNEFADKNMSYLDYIVGNWDKLKILLERKSINIYVFMNLIYKDLSEYLNKQKQINDYQKLIEIENEIENIIENKIFKKTEKIKDKEYSKYEIFIIFYNKNKNKFREKDSDTKTSLIKEINGVENYKDEKKYPYYKNFLYSDYTDIEFFENKLEKENKEKYPVVELYLNKNNHIKKFDTEFLCFNFVIKSLLNQYSGKISKHEAKKLTFDKSNAYKQFRKRCDSFIKIINSKIKGQELTEKNSLEDYFIDGSNEKGKKFIDIYKEYAKYQNESLKDIITKINEVSYEDLECQEINIQEAQKEDLLTLEFENKSESNEILLMNTFREIYGNNSKVKYNNYNLFSVDFDKIEKLFEDTLIRNACFLKTDEIVEMKYSGEEFLNDGIFEFNKNIKPESLDEKVKMEFLIFYEKNLQTNLTSCLEIDEGLKNIVLYINKNINKINKSKSLSDIINEGGFPYKINDELKEFLKNNTNIIVDKLSNLIIYFENLYFELAMEKSDEYKVKMEDEIKTRFDEYYKEKSGQLLTKEKLSITIIKLLLNVKMNKQNGKTVLIENEENLFDYLNNKYLWSNEIYTDNKFSKECEEYKKLDIKVKNAYDFYSYISTDYKDKFDKEKNGILDKIRKDENEKKIKEKEAETEKMKKKIEEEINETNGDNQENETAAVDVNDDDMDDLDAY